MPEEKDVVEPVKERQLGLSVSDLVSAYQGFLQKHPDEPNPRTEDFLLSLLLQSSSKQQLQAVRKGTLTNEMKIGLYRHLMTCEAVDVEQAKNQNKMISILNSEDCVILFVKSKIQ